MIKDIFERELKEGDEVSFLFMQRKNPHLCIGKIVGFTDTMAKIEFIPPWSGRKDYAETDITKKCGHLITKKV